MANLLRSRELTKALIGPLQARAEPALLWANRWLEKCAAVQSQPLRVRLATAALIVVAAFIVRWWLMGQLGPRMAYPIFYPAVMIAALIAGAAAGTLAVILSVLLVSFVILPLHSGAGLLSTAIFVLVGALTVFMTAALQNAQLQVREAAHERDRDLRLRATFNQQFQFMAVLSPDGRLLDVNEMPLKRAGFKREDVVGQPFGETPWWRGLPEIRQAWPGRLAAAAAQDGPLAFEDRFNASDGSVRTADATITAVRAEDGGVRFFIVQAHDKTESKRAETELRASKDQLLLAVEVAQLGFFDHDQRRDSLSWSDQMRAILGVDAHEPVSLSTYLGLIHPADRVAIEAGVRQAHDPGGEGHFSVEHRVVLRGGDERWVALRAQTVFEGSGEERRPLRTIGVLLDITERRQAEEHQRMLIAELDHRVKNTLARVSAVAEFSRSSAGSIDAFIASFEGRLQSMAKAHQLLSRNHWYEVALAEVVRQQMQPFDKPGRVHVEGCEILLTPDPAQALAMLFHELATNAAKYGGLSGEHGRVSITWHRAALPLNGNKESSSNGKPLESMVLVWQESGGPQVAPPTHAGFGSMLIRDIIGYELDGRVELVFAPSGLSCTLSIPDLTIHTRRLSRRNWVDRLSRRPDQGPEYKGAEQRRPS